MMPMALVWLGLGLLVLTVGADVLVRGASHLAARFGVAPLVVGLTVVAFGTSAPELAVSTYSSFHGQSEIALGNVVGSNIFNVLFILGLSAVIAPLAVAAQIVRLEVPLMIGISLLLWVMALDGTISLWEAGVLLLGIIGYVILQVRLARRERSADVRAEFSEEYSAAAFPKHRWTLDLGQILAGLVLLVLGSRWLVQAAVGIASSFGVSQTVIGLTIVAAGTSLPETATSVVASLRGQRDIAVGNVIGSNIFNLLCVLGASGLMRPTGLEVSSTLLAQDIPVMVAVAVACLPLLLDQRITRGRGILFLLAYAAYAVHLVLSATGAAALPAFRQTMLAYVLPLTVLTVFGIAVQASRRARG